MQKCFSCAVCVKRRQRNRIEWHFLEKRVVEILSHSEKLLKLILFLACMDSKRKFIYPKCTFICGARSTAKTDLWEWEKSLLHLSDGCVQMYLHTKSTKIANAKRVNIYVDGGKPYNIKLTRFLNKDDLFVCFLHIYANKRASECSQKHHSHSHTRTS